MLISATVIVYCTSYWVFVILRILAKKSTPFMIMFTVQQKFLGERTCFKCREVGEEIECIFYKKNNLLDINGYLLTNQFLKLGKYEKRKTKTKKTPKYGNSYYSSVSDSDSDITLDKHQRHIKRNLIFHTN